MKLAFAKVFFLLLYILKGLIYIKTDKFVFYIHGMLINVYVKAIRSDKILICTSINILIYTKDKIVTSKYVWKFQNSKAIMQWRISGSELGGSGGLVGSWLGQLSNDVNLLPMNYINRGLVNIHTKRKSWDVIQ